MFKRLHEVAGASAGIVHAGLPTHRHPAAVVAADPGLLQDQAIGNHFRASLLADPYHPADDGMRGKPQEFMRGYTVSPQHFVAIRETKAVPPLARALPYLPGRSPILHADLQ